MDVLGTFGKAVSILLPAWQRLNNRPMLHFEDSALQFEDARNINQPGDNLLICRTYLMQWRADLLVCNRGPITTTLLEQASLSIEGQTLNADVQGERKLAMGDAHRLILQFNDDHRQNTPSFPVPYVLLLRDAFGKRYRIKGVCKSNVCST
jgi:hypothetical protein